jgi:hypothetical protein
MSERNFFDLEALIRALIIGLGTGFIVTSIASIFTKKPKGHLITFGGGLALIITLIIFPLWPSLIKVPDLSNLSRDEAEDLLIKKGLFFDVIPQYHHETEPGRVIPYSQDPLPGIKVHKGTKVKFAVALPSESFIEKADKSSVSVSLFRPKTSEKVHCARYADGIYRFSVVGSSKGLSDRLKLLLWIRPENPPSETPGWYLQRPPVNGIGEVETNGSWQGIAQVGNEQWPPHEGDILDVAVTIVDVKTANQLLAEPGVVTRINLPGITSDIALSIVVKL